MFFARTLFSLFVFNLRGFYNKTRMNRYTKIFSLLFSILCLCGWFGCSRLPTRSNLKNWMEESSRLRILSTTAQVDALVSAVGGERVHTWVLIQGDLDPHSYELVKGDAEKFALAEWVFSSGLGLEHGASLSSVLRGSSKTTAVSEKIASMHPDRIVKRGSVVDPHLWMDISLWKLAVPAIRDDLSRLDPEGESYYAERAQHLMEEMDQVHGRIQHRLASIPSSKRYLLTSHDAFRYFTRSYLADPGEREWTDRFAAPEGLAPDGQLSSIDIQRMIEFVRANRLTVLFPESNVSRDSIRKIASAGSEMGISLRVCEEPLYGDSMSGLSYFEMMETNAEVIARYLHE